MNGQAKIDFEKWIWIYVNQKEKQNISIETFLEWFYNTDEIIRNAYYILWFDSVGIYINTSGLTLSKTFIVDVSVNSNCEFNYDGFNTRQQAAEKAIEQAIILYNEKFKENE